MTKHHPLRPGHQRSKRAQSWSKRCLQVWSFSQKYPKPSVRKIVIILWNGRWIMSMAFDSKYYFYRISFPPPPLMVLPVRHEPHLTMRGLAVDRAKFERGFRARSSPACRHTPHLVYKVTPVKMKQIIFISLTN